MDVHFQAMSILRILIFRESHRLFSGEWRMEETMIGLMGRRILYPPAL
jgi:hypothetical protein